MADVRYLVTSSFGRWVVSDQCKGMSSRVLSTWVYKREADL